MRWFQNLATGAKLHLGFGLVMLFLAATAWIANSEIGKLQAVAEMLHERDFGLSLAMSEIRADLARERVDLLGLKGLPPGPAKARLSEDIRNSSTNLDVRLQRVSALAAFNPEVAGHLADMKKAFTEYRKNRDADLAVMEQSKTDDARGQDSTIVLYNKVRDASVAIGEAVQERAALDMSSAKAEALGFSKTFLTLAALAFLCVALLVMLLNHAIARPLVRIAGMAERVAAGDLTMEVQTSGRSDEVGVMQAMFGKMVTALRQITRQIHDATGVLAAAATEIMAATTQLASSATETASAVAQTTTTLEEVKQTSQVSSQKAKAVSDEARKAAEVAGAGRRSVEETIEGMEGIQRQMTAIADSIINLSTQSQAIGEIITSVDDLAAQSKLLAVNASIEAAKAGEEGKGFSVVAQEVKSLAEQSKQATAQVRSILGDIQKATSSAVTATEQGGKAVEAGVSQSARASESITELTENIAQAAQAATQIAATSQQQYVGVDQVTLAMENIKTASSQTVVSTRQAEAAAHQLHELGQNLKQIVERFKV